MINEDIRSSYVLMNAAVHLEGIVERCAIVGFASGRAVEVVVVGTVTCVETFNRTFGVNQCWVDYFGRLGEGTLIASIARKGREGEVLRRHRKELERLPTHSN